MKNNKGFTLIELLAVIVILAVIALIVTPIVTGIIAQAKDSANARSVEGHVSDVNYAILTLSMAGSGELATFNQTGLSLPTAVKNKVQETNTADTIVCDTYTILNGVVTAASGCNVSGKDYSYSNTTGASE